MSWFSPKVVHCPAGQWTVLMKHQFVQMPMAWTVRFSGPMIDGELEEKKSAWIFPGAPITRRLAPAMQLERGWFNTFYTVRVKPVADVSAEIS